MKNYPVIDLYFWNKDYKDSDEYKKYIKGIPTDWFEYKLKCVVSTINPTIKQKWESQK